MLACILTFSSPFDSFPFPQFKTPKRIMSLKENTLEKKLRTVFWLSVTFARERTFLMSKYSDVKKAAYWLPFLPDMVPLTGIELVTFALRMCCSTTLPLANLALQIMPGDTYRVDFVVGAV